MFKIRKSAIISKRNFSTLKDVLKAKIQVERENIKMMKKNYGEKIIDNVTVNKCLNGSRNIKSIFWEPSLLDENKGICFRDNSIEECQKKLPSFKKDGQMMPESMFWLLITGDIPSKEQVDSLKKELLVRSYLPDNVIMTLQSLPKETHPMNALSLGLMLCQNESHFKKSYENNVSKVDYWEYAYQDILNIIAKLPVIASVIYRNKYHNDINVLNQDKNIDYSGNFCKILGFEDE